MDAFLSQSLSNLSLNRENTSPVHKLPHELLKIIFRNKKLSNNDLLEAMIVCKRWNLMAKEVLCEHVKVRRSTKIRSLLSCMKKSNNRQLVRSLDVSNRPCNQHTMWITKLLSMVEKLEVVTLRKGKPYHMLREICRFPLKNLQSIEVLWETCRSGRATKNWFYAANYHKRQTITTLRMPRDDEDLSFWLDDTWINLTRKEYLECFEHLVKLTEDK